MGLGSLISNDIGMITGFLQNRSAGQQQQKRDEDRSREVNERTKQIETGQTLDIMSTIASLGARDAQTDAAIDAAFTKQLELATAISVQTQRTELARKNNSAMRAVEEAQLASMISLQKANAAQLGSLAGQKENSRVLQDNLYALSARNVTIDGAIQMRDKVQQLMQPQLPAAAAPQAIQGDQSQQPMQGGPTMGQGADGAKGSAAPTNGQPGGPQPAAQQALAPGMTWEQSVADAGLATPAEAEAARKQREDADKIARDQAEADQEDEEQYLNAETTRYREVKDKVGKARESIALLDMEKFPKLSEVAQVAAMASIAKDNDNKIIKAISDAYGTASPAERATMINDVKAILGGIADDSELELADLEPEVKARKERQRARFKVKAGESITDFAERYATDQKWDTSKPPTQKQKDEIKNAFLEGRRKK